MAVLTRYETLVDTVYSSFEFGIFGVCGAATRLDFDEPKARGSSDFEEGSDLGSATDFGSGSDLGSLDGSGSDLGSLEGSGSDFGSLEGSGSDEGSPAG